MTSAPSISHLLHRTLQVWRPGAVGDGAGGQVLTWSQVGTVAARVSRPTSREVEVADRHGARRTHDVYTAPDADVRRGDQLRDTGLVLEVLGTVVPSVPSYLRCDCESQQDAPNT